jgi:hypothetical protein
MADDSISMPSGLHIASQREVKGTEKSGADELLPDSSRIELSDSKEDHKAPDPEDKAKEDTVCPCSDEAHNNLEEWHKKYLACSVGEKALFKDKFNKATLEEKIEKLRPQVPVSNGYCPSCQNLLNKWSEIIPKVPEYHPGEFFGVPYQQPHFKNTLEFEAGYRSGCRLCWMLAQCSIKRGYSLELWHRFENRLNCLGKSTVISVSVESDHGYYNLTLTWPGLDNFCWLPANPLFCVNGYDKGMFPTLPVCKMKLTSTKPIYLGKGNSSTDSR